MFLDADSFPLQDPVRLLESQAMADTGAVFWQDYWAPAVSAEVRLRAGLLLLTPFFPLMLFWLAWLAATPARRQPDLRPGCRLQ